MTETAEAVEDAPPREELPPEPDWWVRRYTFFGTAFGLIFIWLSLTPSLLPRGPMFQGIVSGSAGAIGYGLGVFGVWLVRFMQSKETSPKAPRWAWFTLVGVGVGMMISRRRNPDLEPADPRHPLLSAAGVGVGVSIQAPGRLILLIAGGYRIGDLAGSAAVAVAFAAVMLAIWQLPIWGTMILSIVAPDRFQALERRARPALERVESGPVGAILVAAIGILLVIRGLTS